MAILTDRCVMEVFDGIFVLSRCFLGFFLVVVVAFCHRTKSDLFRVFSFEKKICLMRQIKRILNQSKDNNHS